MVHQNIIPASTISYGNDNKGTMGGGLYINSGGANWNLIQCFGVMGEHNLGVNGYSTTNTSGVTEKVRVHGNYSGTGNPFEVLLKYKIS